MWVPENGFAGLTSRWSISAFNSLTPMDQLT
jgi:hypothetical protein